MIRTKQRIIGMVWTLSIQGIIGIIGAILFFKYYEDITKNDSMAQAYSTQIDTTIEVETTSQLKKDNGVISYVGVFGSIQYVQKAGGDDVFNQNGLEKYKISLDSSKIYLYHILQTLLENKRIDGATAHFILESKKPQQVLQDIIFLSQYTNNSIQTTDIPTKQHIKLYEGLLQKKDFTALATALQNLESVTKIAIQQNNQRLFMLPFSTNENFAFLEQSFLQDPDNTFLPHVQQTADILMLDPHLIQAAILGEQVRGFFTYRGVAKKLLTEKTNIMSMAQGSYGIGGIKLETAENIEKWIQANAPDMREKHFVYPNSLTKDARKERLEGHNSTFYQTLYVGAVLKEIIVSWKKAGYDIQDQPGVILTLYNIGNRTPHADPQLGGASIEIENTTYTFGGLGMFLYYYAAMYY